jgi:PAS domain S-box-containing protein
MNEQFATIRDLIQYNSKRQDKVSILQAASARLRGFEAELGELERKLSWRISKEALRGPGANLQVDPSVIQPLTSAASASNRALDFFAQHVVTVNHRSAFAASSAPMCIAEVGGGFVDVNDALLEMWGYSREDLIGKPCCSYAHPDDMVNIVTNITQLFTGRRKAVTVMKRIRHASGRWLGYRSVTWIVQGEDNVDVDPTTGKKRRVAQYLQSMLFPTAWHLEDVEQQTSTLNAVLVANPPASASSASAPTPTGASSSAAAPTAPESASHTFAVAPKLELPTSPSLASPAPAPALEDF